MRGLFDMHTRIIKNKCFFQSHMTLLDVGCQGTYAIFCMYIRDKIIPYARQSLLHCLCAWLVCGLRLISPIVSALMHIPIWSCSKMSVTMTDPLRLSCVWCCPLCDVYLIYTFSKIGCTLQVFGCHYTTDSCTSSDFNTFMPFVWKLWHC